MGFFALCRVLSGAKYFPCLLRDDQMKATPQSWTNISYEIYTQILLLKIYNDEREIPSESFEMKWRQNSIKSRKHEGKVWCHLIKLNCWINWEWEKNLATTENGGNHKENVKTFLHETPPSRKQREVTPFLYKRKIILISMKDHLVVTKRGDSFSIKEKKYMFT